MCEEVLLNDIYTNEECFDLLELSSLWFGKLRVKMDGKISGRQCQIRQPENCRRHSKIFITATP